MAEPNRRLTEFIAEVAPPPGELNARESVDRLVQNYQQVARLIQAAAKPAPASKPAPKPDKRK